MRWVTPGHEGSPMRTTMPVCLGEGWRLWLFKHLVMTLSQMPLKFRVCPWSALMPRSQPGCRAPLSSYQYPRDSLHLRGRCIHEKGGSHSTSRASGSLLSIGQGLQAPRDLHSKSKTIPSSSSKFFPRDWLIEYPHPLQLKDPTPSTLGHIFQHGQD